MKFILLANMIKGDSFIEKKIIIFNKIIERYLISNILRLERIIELIE